jgi:hypothetical protein
MGELMRRFVEEADRGQCSLLPECLDDFIDESNPVRVIDVFVDALECGHRRRILEYIKETYNALGQGTHNSGYTEDPWHTVPYNAPEW